MSKTVYSLNNGFPHHYTEIDMTHLADPEKNKLDNYASETFRLVRNCPQAADVMVMAIRTVAREKFNPMHLQGPDLFGKSLTSADIENAKEYWIYETMKEYSASYGFDFSKWLGDTNQTDEEESE